MATVRLPLLLLSALLAVSIIAAGYLPAQPAPYATTRASRPTTTSRPSRDESLKAISKSLIAWWPADGHSQDIIGGNDLESAGNINYTEGRRGNCFTFRSDELYVPKSDDLKPSSFTIAMWCKGDKPSNIYAVPLSTMDAVGHGYRFSTAKDQDVTDLNAGQPPGGAQPAMAAFGTSGEFPVWDNKWHHVVGTLDDGVLSLYVDGELRKQSEGNSVNYSETRFTLGVDAHLWGGQDRHYLGELDEIMVFKRALDERQVRLLYDVWEGEEKVDAQEAAELIATLKESSSPQAFRAMVRLARGGKETLSAVKSQMDQPGNANLTARIEELDADSWTVREQATEDLIKAGPSARPQLREALKQASPEAKYRIELILGKAGAEKFSLFQRRLETILNR